MDYSGIYERRSSSQVLGSGSYNDNFLIKIDGISYIMRVPQDGVKDYDLRSLDEFEVLSFLAKNHFRYAPKLKFISREPRFLIMEYVNGTPLGSYDISIDDVLRAVKQLHEVGKGFLKRDGNGDTTERFFRRLKDFSIKQISRIQNSLDVSHILDPYVMEGIDRISAMNLQLKRTPTLCHGDLTKDNIIVRSNHELCFIDFELAAVGDEIYDFAILCNRSYIGCSKELDTMISLIKSQAASFCEQRSVKDLLQYMFIDLIRSLFVVCDKYLRQDSKMFDVHLGRQRLHALRKQLLIVAGKMGN